MSALPPKADIAERDGRVRFVPQGDISGAPGIKRPSRFRVVLAATFWCSSTFIKPIEPWVKHGRQGLRNR
jgi:hypothetical protein